MATPQGIQCRLNCKSKRQDAPTPSHNMISHAGQTDRGHVRERNEDDWYANSQQGLYLVADGAGGMPHGELASKVVVESLPALLRERLKGVDRLDDPKATEQVLAALAELSDQLRNKGESRSGFAGMGSTVVLAMVRDRQALVAHMGDSRAYLLRRQHLEQLTTDHTITQEFVDCGLLSPDNAATHFGQNRLTRYVGMHDVPLPEARRLDLLSDDRLLLCTDGLTKMVSDEQLHSILIEEPVPKAACRRLISAANEAGGTDNITALIVSFSSSSLVRSNVGSPGAMAFSDAEDAILAPDVKVEPRVEDLGRCRHVSSVWRRLVAGWHEAVRILRNTGRDS